MLRARTSMTANAAYHETDDFITRFHVMPILWDDERRALVIEEHKRNPIGQPGKNGRPAVQHSEDLGHLLDKLRRNPSKGKEVKVAIVPFEKYAIGILPGKRGAPIEVLTDRYYASDDECEHAIFLRRVQKLLDGYPKPNT